MFFNEETAREVIISNFSSRFSTLVQIGSRFSIFNLSFMVCTARIFLAMLSSAVTFKCGYVIAIGIDGKPPPVPMSSMVLILDVSNFSKKFSIARESKTCFSHKYFSSFFEIKFTLEFYSKNIFIYSSYLVLFSISLYPVCL